MPVPAQPSRDALNLHYNDNLPKRFAKKTRAAPSRRLRPGSELCNNGSSIRGCISLAVDVVRLNTARRRRNNP